MNDFRPGQRVTSADDAAKRGTVVGESSNGWPIVIWDTGIAETSDPTTIKHVGATA